jgi:hypothetical protein
MKCRLNKEKDGETNANEIGTSDKLAYTWLLMMMIQALCHSHGQREYLFRTV